MSRCCCWRMPCGENLSKHPTSLPAIAPGKTSDSRVPPQALREKVNAFDIQLAKKTSPFLVLFTFFPFGLLKALF